MIKLGSRVWAGATRNKERLGTVVGHDPEAIGYNVLVEFDCGTDMWFNESELRDTNIIRTPEPSPVVNSDVAIKNDCGKADMALLPTVALEQTAYAMMDGEGKYGRYNYLEKGGMNWTKLISAANRHIGAFNNGEDFAKDSGVHHLGHAAANLMMLLHYYYDKKGKDNRWKP